MDVIGFEGVSQRSTLNLGLVFDSSSKPVAWLSWGRAKGSILEPGPYKFTHDADGDGWVVRQISGNDHADD